MDSTNQGRVVQTRWRYDAYNDEPHDIIYEKQKHGYVNAKMRPVMILGVVGADVLAVPLKTKTHPDGRLKYGAKKAMAEGIMYEPSETASRNAGGNHKGGTIIDLTEIRRIPIKEFSFRSLTNPRNDVPYEYPESTLLDIYKQLDMKRPMQSRDIQSIPINQNPRIHKDDIQVKFEAAQKTIKKLTKSRRKNELASAKDLLKDITQDKRKYFTTHDTEKRQHETARSKGLTREQMEESLLSMGLEDLSAQDDIQL